MTALTLLPRSTSALRRVSSAIRRSIARRTVIPSWPSAWSWLNSVSSAAASPPATLSTSRLRSPSSEPAADRVDHVMVDGPRRLRRGAGIDGEFGEFLADQGAVAGAGFGDPPGDVGADDQPFRPRHVERQPIGVAGVGDVGGEARRWRGQSELEQFGRGPERAGDDRRRVARRRRLDAAPRSPPGSSPAGSTRSSARRRTSRSTPPRQPAGRDRPSNRRRQVDPLGIGAHRRADRPGERAAARSSGRGRGRGAFPRAP